MTTKTYTIKMTIDGDGFTLNRENDGFNLMELIGILEHTQLDLIDRMKKGIKPDTIETKVITEKQL